MKLEQLLKHKQTELLVKTRVSLIKPLNLQFTLMNVLIWLWSIYPVLQESQSELNMISKKLPSKWPKDIVLKTEPLFWLSFQQMLIWQHLKDWILLEDGILKDKELWV